MTDFKVDTNGQCFLCMGKISPQISSIKLEPETESDSLMNSPLHSLQYLSRYLKMDMRKVFDEEVLVPPELVAKVKKARLKVELCRECACLNGTFSKLCRQLEKIEMEMASYVKVFHTKLLESISDSETSRKVGGFDGKLRIAEVLRVEAKQKCNSKLCSTGSGPRIKIENLSLKQVNAQTNQIKCKPLNNERGAAKEEYFSVDLDDYNDDNARNDYFENYDDKNEESKLLCFVEPPFRKTDITVVNDDPEMRNHSTGDPATTSKYKLEDGIYKCGLCTKTFGTKQRVQVHYENIHLKIRYKCNLCEKEFVTRGSYQRCGVPF